MAVVNGSTLFAGDVSKAAIYDITKGSGFQWGQFVKTEINIGGKPRQLTRGEHSGNPITENTSLITESSFATTATITIDGRQLSVSPLMVPQKMPLLTWKETFPEYQPTGLNVDLKANPKIWNVVYSLIIDAAQAQMNELHSIGDSSLLAPDPMRFYDGFTTLILADADATQVGTPAVLTSANIISYVRQLVHALPGRLRNKPNLKVFSSIADFDLYQDARADTQNYVPTTDIAGKPTLLQSYGNNINMVPIDGMPKNFMFATLADTSDKSNLVQGVWIEGDTEALKMFKITEGDQEFKILLRMDLGVQYKTGKDIFYLNNV